MYDTMGKRIKYLREQHQMTQSELAEKLGVSNRAVSSWELDIKEARMGAIEKMAQFFGVRKIDIIDGCDAIFNPTHIILREEENSLIIKFRELDKQHKQMILSYIDFLASQPQK